MNENKNDEIIFIVIHDKAFARSSQTKSDRVYADACGRKYLLSSFFSLFIACTQIE